MFGAVDGRVVVDFVRGVRFCSLLYVCRGFWLGLSRSGGALCAPFGWENHFTYLFLCLDGSCRGLIALILPVVFACFVVFSTWLFLLKTFKALNGLLCADVPLRNYSLTHSEVSTVDEAPRLEPMSEPVGVTDQTLERPDVIVVESADGVREEYIVKSEIDSSGEETEVPPGQQLSQGNAMVAAVVPIGDSVVDSDSLFTKDELREAQQKDDGVRISIEFWQKGSHRIVPKSGPFLKTPRVCFCNLSRCRFVTAFCTGAFTIPTALLNTGS